MDNKIFELADKLKAEKDENCDYLFLLTLKHYADILYLLNYTKTI